MRLTNWLRSAKTSALSSPADGTRVRDLGVPDGSLVISILRDGTGFVPLADSVIESGDEVLLVLDSGLEDAITQKFAAPSAPFTHATSRAAYPAAQKVL